MNARQTAIQLASHAVQSVLKTITAKRPDPALEADQAALDEILADINTYGAVQAEPITGKTAERDRVHAAAAEATSVIARLTHGYALNHALPDLAAHVDLPFRRFARGRFTERIRAMRQVHTAATGFVEQLAEVNVTPAMLEEQLAKVNAAEAVVALPRSTIATRRMATERIAQDFRKLKRLFRYKLDPQFDLRRASDPEAYALYRAARLVIDRPGGRIAPPPEPPATAAPAAVVELSGSQAAA